jgi:hypothetical protein
VQQHALDEQVLAFFGGQWFTGTAFQEKTAYVVDGVLTFEPPARVDATIHLEGGYVVPPFGEAHNHNVEHSSRIGRTIGQYLRDGVFYVRNPNNLPYSPGLRAEIIVVPGLTGRKRRATGAAGRTHGVVPGLPARDRRKAPRLVAPPPIRP